MRWRSENTVHAPFEQRSRVVEPFAADLYFYIVYGLYFMQVTSRTNDPKEQSRWNPNSFAGLESRCPG